MNYGSGVYGWWIHRFVRFFFAFLMVLSLSGVTPAAAHTTNPVQSATENTDLPTAHELRLQSETDVKQSAIEQPDTTILCTDDQQTEGSDQCSTVPLNRLGIDRLWYYTTNEHGGGNTSRVNVSNGNLVFQHFGGSISALGFDVLLLHTYNSQATRNTTPESSEDPYASIQRSSSFYGNVWSFIHDIRLFELDEGNTVVLRDGTGTTHRIFTKEADENNIRTYARPLFNGANLTKDLSEQPVDPERVYVLTNDIGATEYFFDADGKLTRMEDLNENYLDFSYDQDRLVHIVDQANRSTILEYTRNRLTKIIDMAGRISTYAYDQRGNLITIKHAVGTADEVTTQ
ncbi:MAG: RHS repeat domain-containing protein, partial [Chloroflexota bacterium]